jgi:hypothetical protein
LNYDPNQCLPQMYLRAGGTLDELREKHGITAKRHSIYTHLVQLKYSQIESDFNNPLVRQCRGLILDEAFNWTVVARPFDKFGNLGESYVPQLDWSSTTIQEKLDGSLMIFYNHAASWHVATSGTPDAGGEINDFDMTFEQLFWEIWRTKQYQFPSMMHNNLTFMFELTSPYNKVVVHHRDCKLRLIGVRNRATGHEIPARNFVLYERVKEFAPVASMEDLIDSFREMDPTAQEGYVVVDKHFNRVKVKHPGYVKLHHLKGSMSMRNMLEVVRTAETDEFLIHFPEWRVQFGELKALFEALVMVLEQSYDDIRAIEVQKDFAVEANKTKWPAAMFGVRNGRMASVREGLQKLHIDSLVKLLGLRDYELKTEVAA